MEDTGEVAIDGPIRMLPLRQVFGIGRNYADHATEQGASVPERPMVFMKALGSVGIDGEPIRIPRICQDREQVDFEGELAVIIGEGARDVPEIAALACVEGYACANDVSARWWQKEGAGGQFVRGKSFDSFCPIGPRVVPASEIDDPQALRIETRVNGEVMQESTTGQMLFSVARLISELSQGTTLMPGTVILTGTPSGVGMARDPQRFLRAGDVVEVEISGIGTLRNIVELD